MPDLQPHIRFSKRRKSAPDLCHNRLWTQESWLQQMAHEQRMSCRKIAEEVPVSDDTIRNWMAEHGVTPFTEIERWMDRHGLR
jgi:hypothetical protein